MMKNQIVKDGRLLERESRIIQLAILKQMVQIRQLLESLIKQEEPKVKKEPLYAKYFV